MFAGSVRFQAFRYLGLPLLVALWGCSSPTGTVSVLVEPESTVLQGIAGGDGPEEIQDGWSVTFDRYVVALGPVELRPLTGGEAARDAAAWLVDLTRIPAQGEQLWELTGLGDGRWDVFFATQAIALAPHDSVSDEDFELVQDEQLTHFITGTMTHPSGSSCPPRALAEVPDDAEPIGQNAADDDCYAAPSVTFSLQVRAEVTYGPCSVDGLPGVAVQGPDETTAALSMHGDHLFFGGFPEGTEGEVKRYAQWLADCDLDLSGEVTTDELERIPPSSLAEFDERFPLGGSPVRPVENLLTYVQSQLVTQGHFEGEGECSISFAPLVDP